MREFPYITSGKILKVLHDEGLSITRMTFYKLEEEGLFTSKRSAAGWRVYTPSEAAIIIKLIKENYGIVDN